MPRLILAVTALVGALLPFVATVIPAGACSCAGPPGRPAIEFVGIARGDTRAGTLGRRWRFEVVSGRGVATGTVVEVDLDVSVEVPTPDGVAIATSSCAIGDAPVEGRRYRVGAYQATVQGERRYFAGGCGGYLQAAEAASEPSTGKRQPVLFAVAALALVSMAAATLSARRT